MRVRSAGVAIQGLSSDTLGSAPSSPGDLDRLSSPRSSSVIATKLESSSPVRSSSTASMSSASSSSPSRSTRSGRSGANGGRKSTLIASSANAGPGRTPQTRRKELSLQNQQPTDRYSPNGSPRSRNNVTRKSRTETEHVRKSSNSSTSKTASTNSSNSRSTRNSVTRKSEVNKPPNLPPFINTREKTKYDALWDVKTIEHGMVRIPTHLLEDLIHRANIEKFYEVEDKPVASGLFATVRKCTHRETGVTYAAKFSSRVRCGVDCSMEILHEIAMLSVCTDSNKIVHLKDVFENKHEIILVLEYAPGGDFQSVLDEDMVPFEEDVQGFLRQILEALEFIHERNIAHLDIKPQNIVLMGQFPNCEIKLCDLEVARVITEDEAIREIIGTPDYVAPEILSMEPITLAADIWSLGVVAYVLLTGFSPFGGDTDQETLRNITTATLDFPPELFEGVSDMAKEFISSCLVRDPKKRPTVKECLSNVWLAPEEEPPSPSPLMLKIPTPDHFSEPVSKSSHGHGPSGGLGGSGGPSTSRRSCQTCRDKMTERKRYLSKSREAIFEKVAQSNLKKSLSKSRERLCDMRLTLSKSRDHLSAESPKVLSRQQDKLYGFRCLSKSQEVISAALGGVPMKRVINGAVSDISHALKPAIEFAGSAAATAANTTLDFVLVPGGTVLLSPFTSDLIKTNSGSLQLLPISESGRSTPVSLCSVATVHDIPCSQTDNSSPNNLVVVTAPTEPSIATLHEVSEEEEDNKSNGSSTSTLHSDGDRVGAKESKDLKESKNYEKKQHIINMSRSTSVDNIDKNPDAGPTNNKRSGSVKETASVGIQVNLCKSMSSPSLLRKLTSVSMEIGDGKQDPGDKTRTSTTKTFESQTLPRRKKEKEDNVVRDDRPLKRGFTHDRMLGLDQRQNYAWREELNRFRHSQKPLRVSELIGTFDRRGSDDGVSSISPEMAEVKQRRRGSLQIQIDPAALGQLAKTAEEAERKKRNEEKLQRRKSTSSLLSNNIENLKIQEQIADILSHTANSSPNLEPKVDKEEAMEVDSESKLREVNEKTDEEKTNTDDKVPEAAMDQHATSSSGLSNVYQRKAALKEQRKKNWDYFEIDHPKAISDKKLQQLKAKYLRRRTESSLSELKPVSSIKEENEELESAADQDNQKVTSKKTINLLSTRSKSVPMAIVPATTELVLPSKSLNLSIDPFTGECIGPAEDMGVDDSEEDSRILRKISSDSGEESGSSSRRSSRSSVHRRRSSHLADILEQKHKPRQDPSGDQIAEEDNTVLEVTIDPLTGKIETFEVARTEEKKRRRLSVEINAAKDHAGASLMMASRHDGDDGFSSLPHTPTDLGMMLDSRLKVASSTGSTGSTTSASTSQLNDDGIFTSSEETLSPMKKAVSLDGDASTASRASAWEADQNRPSSAAAPTAFSRAMERFGGIERFGVSERFSDQNSAADQQTSADQGSQPDTVGLANTRRQSSPMIRPSSS